MTKKKANPKKGGRPSKFPKIDIDLLKKYFLLGLTDFEICDLLGIATSTLYKWQIENPTFSESIKGWKEVADARVERRLYERAMGYSHPSEEIFCAFGKVTRVKTIKHYPPSEIAGFFLLKNRKPNEYRDKQPDPQDEELKNSELVFQSVPKNGDGAKRFKHFFDN